MVSKSTLNKLDNCVATLKSITRNLSSKTPPQIADLYLSSIGLLCHLKKDQSTLHQLKNNDQAQCPPPHEIPAITAVVQDPTLFEALVCCLKVSSGGLLNDNDRAEGSSKLGHSSGGHHHPGTNSRKRTNSIPSEDLHSHASKAIKLSHSPTPSATRLFGHSRNHAVETNANSEFNPTLNVRVVAATILYISFAHLDHWPVHLVRAYAEDCFGPRLWVDNENCKLLVENLRLVHTSQPKENDNDDGDAKMTDTAVLEDAARVSDHYSRMFDFLAEHESRTNSNNNHQLSPVQPRRGSVSSVGSSGGQFASLKKSSSKDDESSVAGNGSKEKQPVKRKPPKTKRKSTSDDGASSSSGEEDEEVIVTKKSGGDDTAASSPSKKPMEADMRGSPTGSHISSDVGGKGDNSRLSSPPKRRLYPLTQQKLNLLKVRQRYFGINKENAHMAISFALAERLDSKAKQNSALLQSLHSFTSAAGVRTLIAGKLEKWLQSPGLSGLARTLFTSTVKSIENCDPPKPQDLEAIRKILDMRLKANQLSAHIENVTAIASTIPTGAVARQMYHQLLSEVLATMGNGADTSASDRLKMVGAIYSALPKDISAGGIAASLMMIIGEHPLVVTAAKEKKKDRKKMMKQIKRLLQLISQQLGASFDVCKLLKSLLSFDPKDMSWTMQDEEDRARLMLQCVLLLVPALPKDARSAKSTRKVALSDLEADRLSKKLSEARKLMLTWFCSNYGPQFKGSDRTSDSIGAGTPDFQSVLGGTSGTKRYASWLKLARCLLFMENGDSGLMQQFVRGNKVVDDKDSTWNEEKYRIDRCYEYGCDFDDDMMWIVLKSASQEDGGIDPEIALTLLEHLFECCNVNRRGSLKLTDIMLAWELYSLVLYEPPETVLMLQKVQAPQSDAPGSRFDDAEEDTTVENAAKMESVRVNTEDLELPQLAYPGLWWRVTILALVMCGVSPQQIGAPVWEEHPTLRAMVKMVISSRYRFPTVDCDEGERGEMKKAEHGLREEEGKIAETLFLPPKPPPSSDPEIDKQNHSSRNRISARQQQKREREQRKLREKEAAEALAEENKRRKSLRAAQKTILLWDPTSDARKPPREAAELLVAVNAHFSLSKIFQRSVQPDFLLMTIGKTTRGAIERAYDWLIPIISDVPDTIARLHASASCVLLLRAYGTEGDERAQLKQLSAPLLEHVRDSIKGRFGQADAVRAFDLLLSDVASHNPERRRCARRVLFDSIGKLAASEGQEGSRKSWMQNILQLEHAKWLVGDAIKHMSTAICFERGSVLRNILLALDDLIAFANENEVEGDLDFAAVFIGLISSRPSVCAEALDRFVDLRTLGVRTVYLEFEKCIMDSSRTDPASGVLITLYPPSKEKEATLSLSLLQGASVLLSIWTEGEGANVDESNGGQSDMDVEDEATSFMSNLSNMLLQPIESNENSDVEKNTEKGLASAKMVQSGASAVSVESWVMLAKGRSNTIARRAALTAPTGFLPRLLLCSGLPRASLLTMIDRLGKLGDASEEQDSVFSRLLIPSAASEWDIGRLGGRRDVARKLLGRLSAYVRMNDVSFSNEDMKISTSFLAWLSKECSASEKPKKQKSKSKSKAAAKGLATLAEASTVLDTLGDAGGLAVTDFFGDGADENCEMDDFRPFVEIQSGLGVSDEHDDEKLRSQVKVAIEENQPDRLMMLLEKALEGSTRGVLEGSGESSKLTSLAALALETFLKLEHKQGSITRIVIAFLPSLSRFSGSPELWKIVFSKHDGDVDDLLNSLLCKFMESWCAGHVAACYEWLLSAGKATDASKFCAPRVIRFLVLCSGQQSVNMDGFSAKITVKCVENWGKSEDFVGASVAFAFDAMKEATASGFHPSLVSRNDLPDWLVLVLALAKCGRVQMKYICETILKRTSKPSDELSLPLLRAVFLRLYVANPHGMSLATAMIRSLLMEAAQEYSVSWKDWRSPLDDQFQDMLDAVTSGTGQRLVRPLCDMSKKHPLLILRKSDIMTDFLDRDAAVGSHSRGTKELRGVIHGQSLAGPLNAVVSGKLTKVHVKHWGYSYTEFIWMALLDILCSIPGPVLFNCGLNMGFLEFLNVNMRLMYVQSQLRRTERDSRLKDKLKNILATFRKNSRAGWEKWMASTNHGLPTLGEMRNVMICCALMDPKDVVKSN